MYELMIKNGDMIYKPIIEGKVVWETQRQGVPGKLTFNVIKDDVINFQEGNLVIFKADNENIFHGFIFTKNRSSDGIISVTAYDQMRYLKNKTYYQYENKTASEILTELVNKFGMRAGTIEDTKHKIPLKNEENKTLFDIVQTALDDTLIAEKQMYVLFDDFGKMTLKNIESMQLVIPISEQSAQDFSYQSSIDENTYNSIEIVYADKSSGQNKRICVKDEEHLKSWGVLQYSKKLNNAADPKKQAEMLLKLHNKKTRTLDIKNALGDVRVRAGASIPIHLDVGDISVKNMMVVESVRHTFEQDHHSMDLKVRGGLI